MRVRKIKIINSLPMDIRITAKAVISVLGEECHYIFEREFSEKFWTEDAEVELIIEIEKAEEGED